jgi:cytochrome c553
MFSARSILSLLVFASMAPAFISQTFAQDAAKGKALFATCIQCHGEKGDGNPEKKAPRISGQHDWYVIKQVTEIKNGVRKNPDMQPFVAKLSEQDIKDLAAYIITL